MHLRCLSNTELLRELQTLIDLGAIPMAHACREEIAERLRAADTLLKEADEARRPSFEEARRPSFEEARRQAFEEGVEAGAREACRRFCKSDTAIEQNTLGISRYVLSCRSEPRTP